MTVKPGGPNYYDDVVAWAKADPTASIMNLWLLTLPDDTHRAAAIGRALRDICEFCGSVVAKNPCFCTADD